MLTVDGRCKCRQCEERTGDIYRMIGACRNCRTGPILMLFRAGDPLDCPTCGNSGAVLPERLATSDEIPAAGGSPEGTEQ